MAKNIIFLIIYISCGGVLSPEILYSILIFNCILCIIGDLQHKKIIITPILVFYLGAIFTNIANLIIISKTANNEANVYSYIKPRYIADATQIWCISCSFIIIGYQLAINKKFPKIDYNLKNERIVKNIYTILLVMNVLTIFGMGVNYKSGLIFKIFGLLNTIGILFFARLWGATERKNYRIYAVSLFVLETYIALTTSYLRFELILPTIYLFVGYFIGKRDLRYLFSYRIVPFAFIIILFSSVFATLQKNRSNFISVFDAQDNNTEEQASPKSKGLILDRSANIAQLTNVVNLVKQNGFYDGRASAPLVIALVPRFLWPEKPKIEIGTWFALEIGAAYRAENGRINNSINMTIPGELYLDFGWLGIVIGSLLMGAFVSMLWNSTNFYLSDYNITGIIFGGYLIYTSLLGFGADLQIVLSLLSLYLVFFIIKKVAKAL